MKKIYKEDKKPQIFILDASAGTGKTYNLSLRYLYHIFNPYEDIRIDSPYRNVLAITFTNKAAKEMRLRIIELLKRICLDIFRDKDEKKNVFEKIGINEDFKIKRKSEELLELLFKNYHYFQVRTIDSFVNSLITNCALLLDINPNFEIEKEVPEYLDYCIDLLLDEVKQNKELKNIFENFVYNFLFIEERKSWFPEKFILSISKFLYKTIKTHNIKFKKIDPKKTYKERLKLSQEIVGDIKRLFPLLNENIHRNFINLVEKFLEKIKGSEKVIINSEDFFNLLKKEEIPIKKNSIIPKELENLWKDIREKMFRVVEYEIYHTYDSYVEIFNFVEEKIKEVSKKKNIIFLEELNSLFNKIVEKEILPEIYLRLSARIYHYLIDEFQDTNILQWENLYPLIYESVASKGSLFIVGDKKQAIYRFRGGEAKLFDKIKTHYFKNYFCKEEKLSQNYRSRKFIVEFNNKIFSKYNIIKFCNLIERIKYNEKIVSDIIDVYRNVKQEYFEYSRCGYVYGELVDIKKTQDYEEVIKPKLKELITKVINQNYDYSDICVLLRKNHEVRVVTEWLIQHNIPVESEQTLDIRSNKLIKEILSLLKFIINRDDNLSFCSFILGDIFLKKASIRKEEIQNFIFFHNIANRILPIYQKFKERYSSVWEEYFSKILEINGSYPLYDIILKIFSTFNILENFSNYHGFFMLLLELVYKIENENGSSIENFLNYFENPPEKEIENFYVKVRKSNSVKVTTIHKSKGLEYNIVILPLLKIDIEVGRQKELTSKFIIKEKDGFAEMIRVKADFEILNEAKNIYDEEFKNLLIDELNTVYVGFTRAKERLYFFVPKKENNKNLAEDLIFSDGRKILILGKEEIKSDIYKDIQQENVRKIEINRYEDWIEKILKEESFPKKESVIYREQIIKGDVLHKVLSYINNLFNKDILLELNSAIEKSKIFYPYISEWDKIKELLYNFILAERIKQFFFLKEAQIYCEKEIVFLERTFIVDRLIVLEKEVYVIDYKLSFNVNDDVLKEYNNQIRQYKSIIKDIYKDKKIKGFLISLDNFDVIEI